jgi:Flp pilus assembly protein TadG
MFAKTLIAKLRNTVRKFSAAQGGNITIIFALTTIPVIGFVGAAVDYSRANSAKAAMQAAVDATALMLSKDVATLTPPRK